MSKQLQKPASSSVLAGPADFALLREVATQLIEAGTVPDHWIKKDKRAIPKEEAIVRVSTALFWGKEAGFKSVPECLSCMYPVNNLPTVYGNGYNILIQRTKRLVSSKERWDESRQRHILELTIIGADGNNYTVEESYGMDEAEMAGHMSKGTYQKYKRDMFRRKCWARAYSYHFSDGGLQAFDMQDHVEEVREDMADQSEYAEYREEYSPEMLVGASRDHLLALLDEYPEHAGDIQQVINDLDDAEAIESKVIKSAAYLVSMATKGAIKSKAIDIQDAGNWMTKDEIGAANAAIEARDEGTLEVFIDKMKERVKKLGDIAKLPDSSDFIGSVGFKITEWHNGEDTILKDTILGYKAEAKSE